MAELQGVFIRNLKRCRTEAGMTQFALAEASSMSPGYIAELESGRKLPSLEALERLATALGVSPCRLLASEIEERALKRLRQPYLLAPEGKDAFIAEVVDVVRRHTESSGGLGPEPDAAGTQQRTDS